MHIDITIVTYNSTRHLKPCIESILRQNVPLEQLAVYIYDNASEDGSAEAANVLLDDCREQLRDVKVVAGDTNLGFGSGHNAAAALGNGELIFILNPDTELTPECIEKLVEAAEHDPEDVAAWEPRQCPYEHPKWYDPLSGETDWCSGAGLLVRREAFDTINGFDPALFLYCEDVDLSWRLRMEVYRLRYIPHAVLNHYSYDDPGKIKMAMYFGNARGNFALRVRYGTWREIARGLVMHLEAFGNAKQHFNLRHRLILLKGVLRVLPKFFHFRNKGVRDKDRFFIRGWDYGRTLAPETPSFHDNAAGIALEEHPKVSILVRTMGTREELLHHAIRSVINQTYPREAMEIVLVQDGKASLNTIAKNYAKEITVRYKALGTNKGRCVAGNTAMELAEGEYCIFLDDDDMFFADHVEQLVATAQTRNAKIAYSYGLEVPSEYSADGRRVQKEEEAVVRYANSDFSFIRLLSYNYLPINNVLFTRQCYTECGGFDEELDFLEDWDLWLRFAYRYRPFALAPKTTAMYRVPMHVKELDARNDEFVRYRQKVRDKHDHQELPLRVFDLRMLYDELAAGDD